LHADARGGERITGAGSVESLEDEGVPFPADIKIGTEGGFPIHEGSPGAQFNDADIVPQSGRGLRGENKTQAGIPEGLLGFVHDRTPIFDGTGCSGELISQDTRADE
jgi:hypothetical protein